MTETEDPKPDTDLAAAVKAEKLRLVNLLFSKSQIMTADYKNTIKHTGGLLTSSMTYAYSRALADAVKLLTKDNNEKPV